MTKGVELIAQERDEQINKHGFDETRDTQYYANAELVQATLFSIKPNLFSFPKNWNPIYAEKIEKKNLLDRYKVAGALIAAEMDRLISMGYKSED